MSKISPKIIINKQFTLKSDNGPTKNFYGNKENRYDILVDTSVRVRVSRRGRVLAIFKCVDLSRPGDWAAHQSKHHLYRDNGFSLV